MNYKEVKKQVVHPFEVPMRVVNVILFIIALIVTVVLFINALSGDDGSASLFEKEGIGYWTLFGFVALIVYQLGSQYGKALSYSVEINDDQFPEVYAVIKDFSQRLELGYVPRVFVVQQGGTLNAFATSFFRKKYISINSDIFEVAFLEHKDLDTLSFVIAHELTHLKRRHATTGMMILESLAGMVPIWGAAQSRVKEYTCDLHACWLIPEGRAGMIILAAGKHLYKKVTIEEYLKNASTYKGLFFFLQNLLADHPIAPKRIKALFDEKDKGKVF